MESLAELTGMSQDTLFGYLSQGLYAIGVLIIGLFVIRMITNALKKIFSIRRIDPTLTPFILSLVGWGLKALLVISVASMVGIETTSFVAVLGAAGLAIGLSLQGSLGNLAGGVMILIFRPFKNGDYIEAQGVEGVVDTIDVFATSMTTVDNKKIIIPNGPLSGGVIKNYTAESTRRVDLTIGVGYGDDLPKAIRVLQDMCHSDSRVLQNPEPAFVGVTDFGDNSVNLTVRAWTATENYWGVFFDLNAEMKAVLDKENISIPFPQRDVHIHNS